LLLYLHTSGSNFHPFRNFCLPSYLMFFDYVINKTVDLWGKKRCHGPFLHKGACEGYGGLRPGGD
jgi:hypothetical protein